MGNILLKPSVKPRSLLLMAAVSNVARSLPHDVYITSGNDSAHMVGSKHYTNEAVDIRSKNFPSAQAKRLFISDVLLRLGTGYDMILEGEGTVNEHFHLEHDPR